MIKLMSFFKRKPGLSVEAFQEYWRTKHADVVVKLPGIQRYVQSHTLLGGYRKGEPAYDGVAEVWVEDTQVLRAQGETPEYAAVRADEPHFIDLSTMGSIITQEHTIKAGSVPPNAVKNMEFVTHRADLSAASFRLRWNAHLLYALGPAGSMRGDWLDRWPGIQRYVQSHTLPGGYRKGEPAYDGVAEVWVEDTQVLRAQGETPEYAAVRADEPHFIDLSTMGSIITQEHTIKAGAVPPNAVKNMEFVTHRADLSIEAFQKHWREVHGPLGAAIPVIRRYVQSHTRLSVYKAGKTPVYDGVALTWFADTQAMRTSASMPEYAATRADEANFIDGAKLPFIITREHVIVG